MFLTLNHDLFIIKSQFYVLSGAKFALQIDHKMIFPITQTKKEIVRVEFFSSKKV